MSLRPPTDEEMLRVLSGKANPETVRLVQEAVTRWPEVARRYDQWASVWPAVRRERIRASALAESACNRVLARRVQGGAADRLPRRIPAGWAAVAAGIAAVIGLVVCLQPGRFPSDGTAIAGYVVVSDPAEHPHSTLSAAVDAAVPGDTILVYGSSRPNGDGPLRITKALQIRKQEIAKGS